MNARGRVGLFLAIAGLLILGASGYLWFESASRRAELQAGQSVLEDSVGRVHESLMKTSLKLRGFRDSMADVPDTMKRYGGKQLMDIGGGYSKTIRKLEIQERDLKLKISALERQTDRERATARTTAMPMAVAGAAATVIGILMMASRRRVGA